MEEGTTFSIQQGQNLQAQGGGANRAEVWVQTMPSDEQLCLPDHQTITVPWVSLHARNLFLLFLGRPLSTEYSEIIGRNKDTRKRHMLEDFLLPQNTSLQGPPSITASMICCKSL